MEASDSSPGSRYYLPHLVYCDSVLPSARAFSSGRNCCLISGLQLRRLEAFPGICLERLLRSNSILRALANYFMLRRFEIIITFVTLCLSFYTLIVCFFTANFMRHLWYSLYLLGNKLRLRYGGWFLLARRGEGTAVPLDFGNWPVIILSTPQVLLKCSTTWVVIQWELKAERHIFYFSQECPRGFTNWKYMTKLLPFFSTMSGHFSPVFQDAVPSRV